jgi:Bacterial regulatory protein, arsR family
MAERQGLESILDRGLEAVRETLGAGWEVTPYEVGQPQPGNGTGVLAGDSTGVDQMAWVRSPDGSQGQVLVEARRTLTPVEVRSSLVLKANLLRKITGEMAFLVIAPWLSPRTRGTLAEHGFAYLDLTGNMYIRLNRPGVYIERSGAQRDPSPVDRSARQGLTGQKAGRLVRVLVDVVPPYGVTELARVTGLSEPYVSRQLASMEEEDLLQRSRRRVVEVDWPALLRARASQYGLLRGNSYANMVARQGLDAVERLLSGDPSGLEDRVGGQVAVTGSWAATAVAPEAIGGQLMLYVPRAARETAGKVLGLIPSGLGADVVLLEAADPVVFARSRRVNGVRHVALSQLALDCLGGTGRMPAEGEALLRYMSDHVDAWRTSDLDNIGALSP